MAEKTSAIMLGKEFRTLFDSGALGGLSDRGLLEQFNRGDKSSEAAFAMVVERHGPMVLRVCRHLLRDGHLTEDAFQVTFLLLARRARAIDNPDALAGWLHRVARRVALRALAGIRRRNERERPASREIALEQADPLERDELCAMVHEEIDRLADGHRSPIVLCALEGLSHEQAAERLRWPVGTVKSRLARGRRRLESRLARRGLVPAVALAAGAAGTSAWSAPVPVTLAVATVRAAFASVTATAKGAGSVSAAGSRSIGMMVRHELVLAAAKATLVGGAVVAAGAAVALVAWTLASAPPRGRPAQVVELALPPKPASTERPTVVPRTDAKSAQEAKRAGTVFVPRPPAAVQDNLAVGRHLYRRSDFGKLVDRAIAGGVRFLLKQQRDDGSWTDLMPEAKTGLTSLVTLALLRAGERPNSPAVRKALGYLRGFRPDDLRSTYAVALQTQVFAAALPETDRSRIAANVAWLQRAQIKPGNGQGPPGAWTYSDAERARKGDNSNSHYALLALLAALESGVAVTPAVWESARSYWEHSQRPDGSWAYTFDLPRPTATMTCAGISSLVIAGPGRSDDESVQAATIQNCGKARPDRGLHAGLDWLESHFRADENFGFGKQWRFYYLDALESVGRLTGLRFIGQHDWYRSVAMELLRDQDRPGGFWQGEFVEKDQVLATSFALLFLANGRMPVLINKLRHAPPDDWDNDPDDIRNLVSIVARDWKYPLTWQICDLRRATVPDLLRAPILFLSGHKAPEFTPSETQTLRAYAERGGVIFAEACCASAQFDTGFKNLMRELFPAQEDELKPLRGDHPLWVARHSLSSATTPLLGIHRGSRLLVIYSPKDLSCYWNQSPRSPLEPAVITAVKVGQNVIDHVTGRKLPPDKLSER
jgi:RNA polymerase sigma factor (sigma-70 family)